MNRPTGRDVKMRTRSGSTSGDKSPVQKIYIAAFRTSDRRDRRRDDRQVRTAASRQGAEGASGGKCTRRSHVQRRRTALRTVATVLKAAA
jgi:hypothetical protein